MLDDKLAGCQVAQRTVGTAFVVVPPPCFDGTFGVIQRQKLMHVQTLVAQTSIEGFDVTVVGGFAGRVKSSCTPR